MLKNLKKIHTIMIDNNLGYFIH